jgi:hypothetical protein
MVNKPAEAHALHTSAHNITFGNHKKLSAISNQQNQDSPPGRNFAIRIWYLVLGCKTVAPLLVRNIWSSRQAKY